MCETSQELHIVMARTVCRKDRIRLGIHAVKGKHEVKRHR